MILKHMEFLLVLQYFIPLVTPEVAVEKELVNNFQCCLYSSKAMNCNWLPANQAPDDLQLYYWFSGESHKAACSDYQYRASEKTGCRLRGDFLEHNVNFHVNGTFNGLSVQNIFWVFPINCVKPPAPRVKITEEGKDLILSWDPPDLAAHHCWVYILNYSKCQESLSKEIQYQYENVVVDVPYDLRCQYRVQVKAVYKESCGAGESDWSDVELYGVEDRHVDWSMTVVAILIPAAVGLFIILFLCCFMKHRNKLFPEIPQPSLIFKDMVNSNKEQKLGVVGQMSDVIRKPVQETRRSWTHNPHSSTKWNIGRQCAKICPGSITGFI
ncbi:interleukin-5 receptor subunit alpha isoform X2 [Coregonus clupeaformis]|uniref:interleukin-5 receptor subunit alpha isoform X2 n=1 Tax=Coregonus clupeaformis TaxID=59861 RepID=UPI001E1C43FF|nr:interleukin-5 receptor subunit alpha isoform X2 [Coregonus clupeaformis]